MGIKRKVTVVLFETVALLVAALTVFVFAQAKMLGHVVLLAEDDVLILFFGTLAAGVGLLASLVLTVTAPRD